jgi:ABC-type glutathione transport system ATPase component
VQYVGPNAADLFDPRQSLRDGIRFAYRLRCRTGGGPADQRINATLRDLGLSSTQADRLPGEVPLEVRRGFALARALVAEPRLLICDGFPSLPSLQVYGREHALDLVLFARSLSGVRPGLPFAVDRPVHLRRGRLAGAASHRLAA